IVDKGRIVAEGPPDQLKGELFGDAIHIEFEGTTDENSVRGVLERLGGIREIALDGRHLHARASHGASAVPAMLAVLEGAGLKVGAVTVARPSLDDVYLRHAGRRFSEADEGTTR